MAEANTSELTNHLGQFTSPEEFVSPEQFDPLKEEYTRVNPELVVNDRAQINVQVLIQSIEEKGRVLAETEQKNCDLTRKVEDLGKQLEYANKRNEQTELKLEDNKTKYAVLERKCNEFFKQNEGLLRELRDKENRIQTVTDSARRALRIGQPVVLHDEIPNILE